jgi:hypothetical protein
LWPSAAASQDFADAGRAAQNQIVVGVDPAALGELFEQRPIEAARGAVIDVLDAGVMAQPGITQARRQAPVAAMRDLAVEQQAEPFGMGQLSGIGRGFDLGEGIGHAGEPELVQLIEGRVAEHDVVS